MNLEIDSIYFEYKGTPILSGTYLKIVKGEIIGILGRNGSGKSTLFKIIFGALKPTFGNIKIDGLATKHGYKNQHVQLLPQEGFLPDYMSLSYAMKLFSQQVSDFSDIEDHLEIRGKLKVGHLSLGQRKIFECALLMNTPSPFLLLDEPFDGVAPIHIEGLTQLIKNKSVNKGILITDHKYEEVMEVSDRLLVIQSGQTRPIEKTPEALELAGYLGSLSSEFSG